MKESFIPEASPEKIAIEQKITSLQEQADEIVNDLKAKMESNELYAEGVDEFPAHLLAQLQRVQEELPINNNADAIDLVIEGLEYDVEIESGVSATETILDSIKEISALFKNVLAVEFPQISEESLRGCVSRLIDTKGDKYFVDAFIDVFRERSEVLRTLTDQSFLVDGQDQVIERLN